MNGVEVSNWTKVKSCDDFWTTFPIDTRNKMLNWIYKHPNVIHSPLHDDILLILDPTEIRKKIKKSKLLLKLPI